MDVSVEHLVEAIANAVIARVTTALSSFSALPRVQAVLLNVNEAAIYLGRSTQSIEHLIFERELPVVRLGRRVHLDRRDLDIFIEKHKS